MQELALKHADILEGSGFLKPFISLTLKDRVCMVQTIALQHTLLHCKAEADQFIEGFKVLGVLSAIREHCNLLMPFYTNKTTKLTPGNTIILYNNN